MGGFFRVGGALVLATALVGGAFYAEHMGAAALPDTQPALIVASNDVRTQQNILDTDGDGVPDWEEELRGSDPQTYTTFTTPTTTPDDLEEPYEEPTTVTDRFAIDFFENLMRTGAGREMSEDEQTRLVMDSVEKLKSEVKDTFYGREHIRITARADSATLRAYGNEIGAMITRYPVESENELSILNRAVQTENPDVLTKLVPIEQAYSGMIADMRTIEVPVSLVKTHIDFLNTLSMIHADVNAMQLVFTDPFPTLLHAQRYEDDVRGMLYALDNIRLALEAAGISYSISEPGAVLSNITP